MAHSERAHATLGASGASKWMNCPGSVRAEAGLPNPTSAASREGTAAHELLEWCLKEREPASKYLGKTRVVEGEVVLITAEMREAVQMTVDFIEEQRRRGGSMRVEQRISLASLGPPPDMDMFGTIDVELYDPMAQHLHIIDLKYGKGVYVDVKDNAQTLYYALGGALALEAQGHPVDSVTCTIVQPRNHNGDPVRSATYTREELRAFGEKLIAAAHETQKPDAPLVVGSWCRWCKAKATCPAQYAMAQEVASSSFDVVVAPPDPTQLSPAQLDRVLVMTPVLKSWLDSVGEYAKLRAFRGELAGWKVVASGKGHRKWTDADKVIALLGDDVVEKSIISVAQAEKLLGEKKVNTVVDYITKGAGASILVPEADARPALSSGIEAFDVVDTSEDT